jgi:protein SCO1/2
MTDLTRRTWLAALGLAPLAGAAVALTPDGKDQERALPAPTPRERIQRRHLPNVELVTHEGRKVRFYDDLVKDKKVVINMMYATCEGVCVPVTTNLARVQRLLGDRVGRDIFFYSVSLKSQEDTPEVLRAYAEMHQVGPGWSFLTGKPADVERLRRALGFEYDDPVEDAETSNHVGMLRYGNEPMMYWAAGPGQAPAEHIVKSIVWQVDLPVKSGLQGAAR